MKLVLVIIVSLINAANAAPDAVLELHWVRNGNGFYAIIVDNLCSLLCH